MAEDFVIEMLHITKEFPGIKANDDITDVYKRQGAMLFLDVKARMTMDATNGIML